MLVAELDPVGQVLLHEVVSHLDRVLGLVLRLPDAERDHATVVELADLVTHEPRLGLEDRPEALVRDLDRFICRARNRVVERDSEVPHDVPLPFSFTLHRGVPAHGR